MYFRFTRSLLGELCKAAYETVRQVMLLELDTEGCMPAMAAAVQTFGSLTNWHPHVHTITAEGVFAPDGRFVPVPHIRRDRALEIWRDKVFDIFFDAGLLDLETIGSMMTWKHSGFNIDTSVRIEADDRAGMQRLIEYISRCPFSLARMIKITDDGKVLYRANNPDCTRYPELGMELSLLPGMSRNYQVFDPLDFLASVTQHIPNKGDHQIRYYGYYSNKSRGMRKDKAECISPADPESLTEFQLKQRLTWATLIKCVYEVDPLECPNCGAQMKIVGFIERDNAVLIKLLLSAAGLRREPEPRPPPPEPAAESEVPELVLDYEFFDMNCI